MSDKIRVMIVDDSAVIRTVLSKMLSKNDKIEVAGTALNGRYALNKIDTVRPDVILLDIEMPEMNGIEFLRECNKLNIKVPTIIVSAVAQKGAKLTMEAMSLGAVAFILKPNQEGTNLESLEDSLLENVLSFGVPNSYKKSALSENRIHYDLTSSNTFTTSNTGVANFSANINRQYFDASKYIQPHNKVAHGGLLPDIEIVTIGISTGGPMALRDILPLFPEDFPVPIVVVQHMPAGFTQEFALSLDKICPLEVKEAADGDVVRPGRILIAPGHAHVKFERKQLATVIKTDQSGVVNGHMPSATVLFKSAVENYGQGTLSCIMTGMGHDGSDTIGDVMRAGGVTIAQDQKTAVVFGMPRVAIENGHIQVVRALMDIPAAIIEIVKSHTLPKPILD